MEGVPPLFHQSGKLKTSTEGKGGQPGPQLMVSHPPEQPLGPLWRQRREGNEEELSKAGNTAVSVVYFSSPQWPLCFVFAVPLSYFPSHPILCSTFSFGKSIKGSVELGIWSFHLSISRVGFQIALLGRGVWWAVCIPPSNCHKIVKPRWYCQAETQISCTSSDLFAILCGFYLLLGLAKTTKQKLV